MNDRPHIVQFGVTGQLGRALVQVFAREDGIRHTALSRKDADFARPDAVASALREVGPADIVVNAAAYTRVDKAESEPQLARAVNAESVARLADACAASGAILVHVSTDYVFDGRKDSPYTEIDPVQPLNVYGATKLEGENAIRARLDRHLILRTSWVYDSQGANFVNTMLRLGREREVLRIVDDQHGAPTAAADIARAIVAMCRALMPAFRDFGTFHFANRGETTWFGFAQAIFDEAGPASRPRLVPIPTSDYPTPARRPMNSRLDCSKFDSTFRFERRPWRDALADTIAQIPAHRSEATT
jgi:dTDP-4-dehydrorhamnose reductase